MTKCLILKSFPFSQDGFTTQSAVKGETRDDIPDNLIAGLEKAGFVSLAEGEALPVIEAKDAGASPENKMLDGAGENKDGDGEQAPQNQTEDEEKVRMAALRAHYKEVVGKKPFSGWDEASLNERIAAATKGDNEGGE